MGLYPAPARKLNNYRHCFMWWQADLQWVFISALSNSVVGMGVSEEAKPTAWQAVCIIL